MSDGDSETDTDTGTDAGETASTQPGDGKARDGAHTELRPARGTPRPRSRVLPPEIEDEPGEDDPFNDMPV